MKEGAPENERGVIVELGKLNDLLTEVSHELPPFLPMAAPPFALLRVHFVKVYPWKKDTTNTVRF